ncbi:MAG: arylesterase, partial [Nitratireductor sp.]
MSRELLVRFSFTLFSALLISLSLFSTSSMAQEPKRIVVLGDSLVAGYGLNPGEAFPEKLQKALEIDKQTFVIENAGVSGDTSSGGLSRLDWSVPDGTHGVILELGANDALRGISTDLTNANLNSIVSRLKERKIQVLLVGMMAPPNMGADYGKQFNAIYHTLAKQEDLVFYPFFLEGVAGQPQLN